MNKIGEHIIQEQNSDNSITFLAAQREIYKKGKKIYIFQVVIAVPIPILISLISPFIKNDEYNVLWLLALYTILATFIELFCEGKTSKLKNLAASIQEKFDTNVLYINWNKMLIPQKPDHELIFRYYNKYIKRNTLDDLYGWYSNEILAVDTNIATLLCQRTSCNYDFALRERYSKNMLLLACFTFLFLFILAGHFEITISQFILNVLLPLLPVLVLVSKQISSNKEAIENLKELKELIEDKLAIVKIGDAIDNHLLRQIQDKIYLHRINSPLLPECLYNMMRRESEGAMNFSIEQKINELKNDHS
jgi:hypothetical protein